MIAIIDYGCGNLFSLKSSLQKIGEEAVITGDPKEIERADRLILPGVGAFADAIFKLRESGLDKVIFAEIEKKKPLLGICLGMQLLFEKSYEFGEYEGLGLISGEIAPIKEDVSQSLRIPHIGWNRLSIKKKSPLFKNIKDGDYVYFVHSFYGKNCEESVIATTDYGKELTAAVEKENIFGCQFHPEKSGEVGLRILEGFCSYGKEHL